MTRKPRPLPPVMQSEVVSDLPLEKAKQDARESEMFLEHVGLIPRRLLPEPEPTMVAPQVVGMRHVRTITLGGQKVALMASTKGDLRRLSEARTPSRDPQPTPHHETSSRAKRLTNS